MSGFFNTVYYHYLKELQEEKNRIFFCGEDILTAFTTSSYQMVYSLTPMLRYAFEFSR